MKADDVKVDLDELKEFKKKNFQDRLNFIDFWVNYMKTHSDQEWSKQQADFIDSQYKMAREFWKNFQRNQLERNNK